METYSTAVETVVETRVEETQQVAAEAPAESSEVGGKRMRAHLSGMGAKARVMAVWLFCCVAATRCLESDLLDARG